MPSRKRQSFKDLHQKGAAFIMPNPIDVSTTRVLEDLGFKAVATTSAGFGMTLGRQDITGKVTREEALLHATQIVNATSLPVNGDLENGFGDSPEEVVKTIQGAIDAGLAGCSIEDYSATKSGGPGYYEEAFAVERIQAAVEAKAHAPNFVLTARAEAPIETTQDLSNTIRRLNAYAEVGADVVYGLFLYKKEHLDVAMREIEAPLNVLSGRPGMMLDQHDLQQMGVTRLSIGCGLARTMYGAFITAAQRLRETGSFSHFTGQPNFAAINNYLTDDWT